VPSIKIQAVPEEKGKFEKLGTIVLGIQKLGMISEVESEDLVAIHHILFCFG
jgi:hypothetical protein